MDHAEGNDGPPPSSAFATRPTLLLRLKEADTTPRELAWQEFRDLYAPMIAGFARRMGAAPGDVDDVVQDVLLGFFRISPTFIYDPAHGRFRGYLKTCTFRALRDRLGKKIRFQGVPLDQVDPSALAVEHIWNDVYAQELLHRALEEMRAEHGAGRTFQAFEQYALLGLPAQEVAQQLGLSLNSVHKAKERVTRALRERVRVLADEIG